MDAQHDVTITAKESLTQGDDVMVYRPRCSCGWLGWAVLDRASARRQLDQHLEQAS